MESEVWYSEERDLIAIRNYSLSGWVVGDYRMVHTWIGFTKSDMRNRGFVKIGDL